MKWLKCSGAAEFLIEPGKHVEIEAMEFEEFCKISAYINDTSKRRAGYEPPAGFKSELTYSWKII